MEGTTRENAEEVVVTRKHPYRDRTARARCTTLYMIAGTKFKAEQPFRRAISFYTSSIKTSLDDLAVENFDT